MAYVKGQPREQATLFPERVEDYIGKDNPVRFIDKFVESLDLVKLGFKQSVAKDMGRPAFDPGDMLRLYIYGYLNGIRTTRRLERETVRNIEVMWLLKKLKPDFRTIANFRRDNLEGLKGVFGEFCLLCDKLNLYGKQLIGIDGSKFQAVNSKDNNFTEKKLENIIRHYEERIQEYLLKMDKEDLTEQEEPKLTEQELQEKIDELEKRKEEKKKLLEKLRATGENEFSSTDPDSRRLHKGDGSIVGYNVQIAVDSKHCLIADFEVTNDKTDQNQLAHMAIKTQETLGANALSVVVDRGYYNSEAIKHCEEAGITIYVEPPSKPHRGGLFSKDRFIYQAETDTYLCPAGEHLAFRGQKLEQGRAVRWYETPACKKCQIKHLCNGQASRNRRITRWVHQDVLDRVASRMKTNPNMRTLRKSLVEHPFGTLKRTFNHGYFLLRGFKKVTTEMSLVLLAYNLKRVLNILGGDLLRIVHRFCSTRIIQPSFR